MTKELYLGIDQGTSSSKAVLLTQDEQVVWSDQLPVSIQEHADGRVEQDSGELLFSVKTLFESARQYAVQHDASIRSMGLAIQRSGVTAWDKTSGAVVQPLMSHRDSRLKGFISEIEEQWDLIKERTGMPASPNFSGCKIALLQTIFPDKRVLVGTLDSYLLHRLSDGKHFVTEDTMASRSMLYDIHRGGWCHELSDIFGVCCERLATVRKSIGEFFDYRGVPVTAVLGDQQAAVLALSHGSGDAVLNLGTIASLVIPVKNRLPLHPGMITTVLYSDERSKSIEYLLEAVVSSSGSAIRKASEAVRPNVTLEELDAILRSQCKESDEAWAFYPIDGTGSPHWRTDIKPVLRGDDVELGHCQAAAIVDYVAHAIAENMNILRLAGWLNDQVIPVGGGLARLGYLLQRIADAGGGRLCRVRELQATAVGAALAARTGVGDSAAPFRTAKLLECERYDATKAASDQRYDKYCELRDELLGVTSMTDGSFFVQ